MWVIFEPVEPRKVGPFRLHGLFLRRQDEAAEVYARIIADDVVTLENGEVPERKGTIFRTRADVPGLVAPLARV